MASPFEWTPEVEDEIFGRLIAGEGIVTMLAPGRDDFLPSETTFYKRLTEDGEFAERYARAREAQAHRETEEIKTIADTATAEDYNVARLRIDARKWRASKLAPKVYGDKVEMEHSGALKLAGVEMTFVRPDTATEDT